MAKPNSYLLDFKICKLTDSILNRISGDSFQTEVSLVSKSDLKTVSKSQGWSFDWKYELNQVDREVYKLPLLLIIPIKHIPTKLGHIWPLIFGFAF